MQKIKKKLATQINVVNKKAFFSYQILEKYVAGIVLQGTEVKSIRMGEVNIKEAYCFFSEGELWIKGMHISIYRPAAHQNHPPIRTRKLLLKKKELYKLKKKKEEQGHTIVPLRLFINEKGWSKLEIALAKGRKLYDKRASIKEKELERKMRSQKNE